MFCYFLCVDLYHYFFRRFIQYLTNAESTNVPHNVISGKNKFFSFFITTLSTSFYTIFFLPPPYKVRRMYICFILNAESISVAFLSHSSYRHSLFTSYIAVNHIFYFSSMLLIITRINVTVLRLDFAVT